MNRPRVVLSLACLLLVGFSEAASQVTLLPTSATFAKQMLGTISGTKAFTLSNAGTNAVTIVSAQTTGDFSIRTTTCKSTLPAGAHCVYNVQFRPVQTGSRTGNLSISYGTASSITASLAGSGVQGQPRFAYVANLSDNTLSVYTAQNGRLRAAGYVLAGANPRSVVPHPTKPYVYVANESSNTVSAFLVSTNGRLVQVGGSPFATDSIPLSVVVDPSGRFVYTANVNANSISAFLVSPSTGALKPVTGSPFAAGTDPYAMAVDPTGRFAYVVNNLSNDVWGYGINQTTGRLSQVGSPVSTGNGPRAISVERSGKFLYVANGSSNDISVFAINQSTGVLSPVGSGTVPTGAFPTALASAPASDFLYVANEDDGTVSVYAINASNGTLTHTQDFFAGSSPTSLSIDPQNKLLYVSLAGGDNLTVFAVNASTGSLTGTSNVAGRAFPIGTALSQGFSAVSYKPQYVYVSNHDDNNISGYKMSASTGVLTSLGSLVSTGIHPNSIVNDPFGRFIFVGNTGDGTVSAYSVTAGTGVISPVNSVTITGAAPVSLFADPSGQFVFVASQFSNNIVTLLVNQATGALTMGSSSFLGSNTYPNAVTVTPSGMYLYATATGGIGVSEVFAFSINPSNGALTSVSGSPLVLGKNESSPIGLVVDPLGQRVYVADESTSSVSMLASNNATGALTEVYDCSFGICDPYLMNNGQVAPVSITVDPTNTFAYAANQLSDNISGMAVNYSGSWLLSSLSSSPYATGHGPNWITIDPSGKFVLVANVGSNSVSTYKLNSTSGGLTANPAVAAGTAPRYLTATPIIK